MSGETNLRSSLADLTVLEIGDQSGDYAALLLVGLGANVIKLEPRAGSPSRKVGPFAARERDPESSLFFWRYNLNKKSIALDLDHPQANAVLSRMASGADIILLSGEFETIEPQVERWRQIAAQNRQLIVCTITPFGLDGPYRDFKSADLTQMAMGGIMAMCGYDPDKDGHYDTPPIAPAMWHSYHIAGEYVAVAVMAAIHFRDLTGEGQFIDTSIHEAVNTCTELAIPIYLHNGELVRRQTARHAFVPITPLRMPKSADGVSFLAGVNPFPRESRAFIRLLDEAGIAHVMGTSEFAQQEKDDPAAAADYRAELVRKYIAGLPAEQAFVRAQTQGLPWAPIRKPEDNLDDPHFNSRNTFTTIRHPELGVDLRYPATVAGDGHAPHMSYERRAPRLGEHTRQVLQEVGFGSEEIEELTRQQVI